MTAKNQKGHFHFIIPIAILVVVAVVGFFVYQHNKPSKVTDPTVKAQLKKASSDLKSVNLAQIKSSVDSTSSAKTAYKNQ